MRWAQQQMAPPPRVCVLTCQNVSCAPSADIVEIKHIMLPPSPRDFKDIYVVFELMETDLHQVRAADAHTVTAGCQLPSGIIISSSCRAAACGQSSSSCLQLDQQLLCQPSTQNGVRAPAAAGEAVCRATASRKPVQAAPAVPTSTAVPQLTLLSRLFCPVYR